LTDCSLSRTCQLIICSDNIIDSFAPAIHQIETEVDRIEDEVFIIRDGDSNLFLQSISRERKNCIALLRLLGDKADVLRSFTKRCNENYQITPRIDVGMYLGDVQDHIVTMSTNLIHFETMLSRAYSNYLATLSINNISQGNYTNRILGKITLLASVLVPFTLVSSIFGMNVKVPLENVHGLGPFFGIIGVMVALCASILLWALWSRWARHL
jgi:magnesium transporter